MIFHQRSTWRSCKSRPKYGIIVFDPADLLMIFAFNMFKLPTIADAFEDKLNHYILKRAQGLLMGLNIMIPFRGVTNQHFSQL